MSREHGSKNKRTIALEEKLERLNCDPIEFLVKVVNNDVECLCTTSDKVSTLDCDLCNGTGLEPIDMKQRVTAGVRLTDSIQPKLASKTVLKDVRKVVVARLNHLNDEEAQLVEDAVESEQDD